ncbi:MAG TPA: DUF1572 family protein [Gemmatimonadaceae bacterium]|nr:DUF1572 family protein [Gemmatimonadaceae bacterium]
MLVKDFIDEYGRWRAATEKAIAQAPDDVLNKVYSPDGNSIAMIVRHVAGNLASRFTDFLTSDGEKPSRDREGEFAPASLSRAELETTWRSGFEIVERELSKVTDEDMARTVKIRGVELTVHEALCRSLAHIANHCGQIILLAKIGAGNEWKAITIPRGGSARYNQNPGMEKAATAARAFSK